jgi:DNA-binding HxlR family transcriptional regulator
VARALQVVGERWAPLVIRELLYGPKRFTDLSRGLGGMSQNVLSQRLRELEDAGVVRRRAIGPPAPARLYELTDQGYALKPALIELGRWGSRTPLESKAELSVDALVLGLETTFDPAAAGDLAGEFELRLGIDHFRASIRDGHFEITRGTAAAPVAVIETDPATLRAVAFGHRWLPDAIRAGHLHRHGDQHAADQFLRCFPMPEPAAPEPAAPAPAAPAPGAAVPATTAYSTSQPAVGVHS